MRLEVNQAKYDQSFHQQGMQTRGKLDTRNKYQLASLYSILNVEIIRERDGYDRYRQKTGRKQREQKMNMPAYWENTQDDESSNLSPVERCMVGEWQLPPSSPALRKQKQDDLCEFEDSLVYRGSCRTAKATQIIPVSKKKDKNKK